MPNIDSIEARILTGKEGTDGTVYLGICGREFNLDTEEDNFKKGGTDIFIMGAVGNMVNKDRNDPRDPQLRTEDLSSFPVWIRFVPDEENIVWEMADLLVTVNPGPTQVVFTSAVPLPFQLSDLYGEFCFLKSQRTAR